MTRLVPPSSASVLHLLPLIPLFHTHLPLTQLPISKASSLHEVVGCAHHRPTQMPCVFVCVCVNVIGVPVVSPSPYVSILVYFYSI